MVVSIFFSIIPIELPIIYPIFYLLKGDIELSKLFCLFIGMPAAFYGNLKGTMFSAIFQFLFGGQGKGMRLIWKMWKLHNWVFVDELLSSLQYGFTEQTDFFHRTLTYPRAPVDLNSSLLAHVTIRYIPCDAFSIHVL